MKPLSQRRAFVVLMTVFATPFVMAVSRAKLGQQADLLTDILKIGLLIAVSTAIVSFCVWSVMHRNESSKLRGSLAGLFSSILIIPIPAAVWTLKTQTLDAYASGSNAIEAALFAIPHAVTSGLYTFVDITKASVIAVGASVVLGLVVAHHLPAKTRA